ncbi:hypothetical protein BASA50_005465 [Batrachochytrium salamandrivorans]|uniref:Reverse transcriptase domain-containing protein n=1 Tax=Batrachochytrium salamandrivorans TaxID=1357716 RepID=A0ABQ8FCN4_9FUNG|nr:hypothetical protein BASA50_005465 [Batrachochytrium salamandrivorans]
MEINDIPGPCSLGSSITSNGIPHGAQVQYLDRIAKLVFLTVTQWRSHQHTLKVDQYQSNNGLFFSRFADHRSCELLIASESQRWVSHWSIKDAAVIHPRLTVVVLIVPTELGLRLRGSAFQLGNITCAAIADPRSAPFPFATAEEKNISLKIWVGKQVQTILRPATLPRTRKFLYDAIQASREVAVQHAAKLAENIFRPTPHGAALPRVKKRPSQNLIWMDPMSRYPLSTTHSTPAAQLTPDCPVSDFSGLSVLPDTSPEPPTHSPTIPENFEIFHFFHDFDPPGMVSDDSESMVPLGDHLTSPVKILTRSLIIHGHVSKLENFHTLLKTLFPPPSCMHPDLRSTCSTCSESLLYSIIAVRRKISAHWSAFFLDIIPHHFQAVMNHLCAQRHMRWNIRAARDNSLYPRPRSNTPIKPPPNSRRIISWNINGLVSKRNDLREHIAEVKPLLLMLQETNLDTNAFRFTAPKYSFIQHPANGPGKRGIALGLLAVLPACEIEGVPGTLILAKVPGLTEQQVWTVGSIYLGRNDRQATLKLVERALELATRDHNRPIIIGGDWNAPHATLQRKVSSWGFGLHVVSFSGSKATFRGRTATARWSSIDHFVCNQAARALLTSPRVNRQPYISDHWPIYASLLAVPPTPPDVFIPTFNPDRCKELAPTISLCNQFSILANLPDGCDSDTVTNRLLDIINPNTAFSSLSNLPLIDTPVPVQHRRLYRATTKKAICRAKNAYRAWLASRSSVLSPQETIQGKYNQYILAEATASRLTKQDDRLRWRSHCTRIDNLLAGGCAKQAWNAAKRMACASGHSCRSSNPIRNEAGVLQFQPIFICNTLRSHYMRLVEAGEGHSLDPTHWETMPQPPQHIPSSSTLSMDLPFSLRELDHALDSMHPRKAPGDDGITTALMQAIAHDPKDHGTGDVNLDRPGALALLRVANTIFLSGVIPKVWRCATIISIPKKGDATLASNLRGISLINVGLKILCKMVQARLSSLLESNNVLVPEQGGFRTREESTAQVCALMDILRRRQIADLNSHIAFINISKAFDTVPIHALLFKLRCIGIPTITMNFLSALCSTSNARIRSGSLLSDPFPVQRGVRQGCPLSGLLFNIFINDVLDGVASISVPGLSQEHHPRGLMFADDIAIIAPSHESLCTSMGTIADWATRWEMSFGVAKCGIMHVAPIPAPLSRLRFCQLNNPLETAAAETADQTPITPSSHPSSPISPSSPLSIHSDISSTSSYHPSSPLSTSSSIYIPPSPVPQPALFPTPATPPTHSPIPSNSMGCILRPRTHRRKLYSRSSTSSACQYRHSHDSQGPLFTPIAPMLTDCGIISLDAHAILARVRLTVKATTLKTPLRTLLLPSTIPSHSSSWFWTRRSRSLIRFVHPNMSLFHFNIPISTNGLFHNPISTNSSITSSNINPSIPNIPSIHISNTTTSTTIPITSTISEIRHQRSKYALERTFQVWGKSKLACSYVQANHASSAKFLRSPALSTGQAIGASLLSLARCGGLWDYPRALKAGILHPTATNLYQLGSPSLCILCHAHLDCKPMAHLVVDCTHPTVFFARVDTQLLQSINDTRVQIFDFTLHTTTTTTTTTTPASPSFSTQHQQQQPRFNWHLGHMG